MSFFRRKNKGGKPEIKIDSEKTAIAITPPTDPTQTLWVDTSAE